MNCIEPHWFHLHCHWKWRKERCCHCCRSLVAHSKDKTVFDLMNISLIVNSRSNFAADCMLHANQLRSQELGATTGAHTLWGNLCCTIVISNTFYPQNMDQANVCRILKSDQGERCGLSMLGITAPTWAKQCIAMVHKGLNGKNSPMNVLIFADSCSNDTKSCVDDDTGDGSGSHDDNGDGFAVAASAGDAGGDSGGGDCDDDDLQPRW